MIPIFQSGQSSSLMEILFYLFLVLSVIEFIVIIFLLQRKKKPVSSGGGRKDKDSGDLAHAYESIKKEFAALKEDNYFLRNHIKSFQTDIKNLEDANSDLLKQKEILLEKKRQLEELQLQKEELFAIAIHDIKNPAAVIKGALELLEEYNLTASEQQEILHSLIDSSEQLVKLTEDITERILRKKEDINIKLNKTAIKKVIDSVLNQNQPAAKKKGVRIINQSPQELPDILIDEAKIREAFDNLINNAIKFAPTGTVVQVKAYFSEKKLTIEVNDNGAGLTEQDLRKVFQKGAMLSAKPTGGEHSSGLGLWIVRQNIEEHGGKVWVKSKWKAGSTFAFELPI